MSIYCANTDCRFYETLKDPVSLNFDNPHYKPIDTNEYTGICKNSKAQFMSMDVTRNNIDVHEVQCADSDSCMPGCSAMECSWNNNLACAKSNTFVSKSIITGNIACKSISLKGITGHRDWSKLLNPDGTAKGGNIDDEYAKKLDRKARNFAIYPDGHHREANPRTPTKRK